MTEVGGERRGAGRESMRRGTEVRVLESLTREPGPHRRGQQRVEVTCVHSVRVPGTGPWTLGPQSRKDLWMKTARR